LTSKQVACGQGKGETE